MSAYKRIRSFNFGEGLSFGKGGRYSILKPIGRGWEGEVYAIADTSIEAADCGQLTKAVKFIQFEKTRAIAPTWSRNAGQIHFNSSVPIRSCRYHSD